MHNSFIDCAGNISKWKTFNYNIQLTVPFYWWWDPPPKFNISLMKFLANWIKKNLPLLNQCFHAQLQVLWFIGKKYFCFDKYWVFVILDKGMCIKLSNSSLQPNNSILMMNLCFVTECYLLSHILSRNEQNCSNDKW